jgi:GTP-binding protein Era
MRQSDIITVTNYSVKGKIYLNYYDKICVMNTLDTTYRSGFIAVMGHPNVGKSTLINALIGQKVAAVSPRPQTTRKRQLGILTLSDAQMIFIDTPGIHYAKHKLGENMNREAEQALEHCDLILFIVDASERPKDEDRLIADVLRDVSRADHVLLVLNKIDAVDQDEIMDIQEAFQALVPDARTVQVSATRRDNLSVLIDLMVSSMPLGDPFYPDDQITDLFEREIAADLIRVACLIHLRDEVPHGIAVRIDEYTERNQHGAYIEATLFVERDSHKGIVIGQKGSMLKLIGITARKEIEVMSGRKVFLRLRVKVRKNWRDDEQILRRFGFSKR